MYVFYNSIAWVKILKTCILVKLRDQDKLFMKLIDKSVCSSTHFEKKKLRLFTVTPYTATDEDFTGNELNLHNIYEKFTRVVESENFSSDRMLSKLDIQPEALRKGFYRRKGERFKN